MTSEEASRRVLIVAPIGRDAELMCTHLEAAGLACEAFDSVEAACITLQKGAGAMLLTEEALLPDITPRLAEALDSQPPWSDVPIIILAGEPFERQSRTFGDLGRRTNVTLIDRPVRIKSLVSATQSALRARERQYQIRDLMETLEDYRGVLTGTPTFDNIVREIREA